MSPIKTGAAIQQMLHTLALKVKFTFISTVKKSDFFVPLFPISNFDPRQQRIAGFYCCMSKFRVVKFSKVFLFFFHWTLFFLQFPCAGACGT